MASKAQGVASASLSSLLQCVSAFSERPLFSAPMYEAITAYPMQGGILCNCRLLIFRGIALVIRRHAQVLRRSHGMATVVHHPNEFMVENRAASMTRPDSPL